jgi:hypothetical protein
METLLRIQEKTRNHQIASGKLEAGKIRKDARNNPQIQWTGTSQFSTN